MPSVPAKKLSQLTTLTPLPAGTTFPVLLTAQAQPDVALRNRRATAQAVGALLGPYAQVASIFRPGGPFKVTNRAAADANYTAGNSTLADITNAVLCINAPATVEFSPDGSDSVYVVKYDGDPARTPGTGMQAYKDSTFTGPTLPAKWVLRSAVRAFTPYGSVNGLTYLWHTNDYSSAYVGAPPAEQFFKYVGPDGMVADAPTGDPVVDAGTWEPSSYTAIPTVSAPVKLYGATGQQTDGALTVKAATESFIALTGTEPGFPVTGNVEFAAGLTLPLLAGNCRIYGDDVVIFSFTDANGAVTDALSVSPDSWQLGVQSIFFLGPRGMALVAPAGNRSAVLTLSSAGELLLDGQPVGGGGGAVAWQAGVALAAGAFTYNSAGDLFYMKQAVANPGTEPTYPVSGGLAASYSYVGGPSLTPTLDYANEITDPPRTSGTRLSPVAGATYQFTTGGTLRLTAPTGQVKHAVAFALRVPAGAPAVSVISTYALDGVNIDTGTGGTARVLAPGTSLLLGYDATVTPARLFTIASPGGGGTSSDDPDLHTTTSGNRHTGPDTYFTPRTAFHTALIDNVASVNYQVSYRDTSSGNAWVYGTPRASETLANTDLAAVPAASWALGVQLRYETVPTDSTKEAQFATNVS